MLISFGRLDSDAFVLDRVLQIATQDTLSERVFRQMEQLSHVDLPITLDDFQRMWKTLILKRVQDVYEREKMIRADHYIRLSRNIPIPAPLGDLLYSIGQLRSAVDGVIYHTIPPARAAAPPNWWTVDIPIVQNWSLLAGRMHEQYMFREFPPITDYDNKPMLLTSMQDHNGFRSVKAFTNEVKPNDAYVRFMNDELYAVDARVNFNSSHLRIVEALEPTSTRGVYVASYALRSNA